MMGGIMRPMTKIEAREVWSRRFLRFIGEIEFWASGHGERRG